MRYAKGSSVISAERDIPLLRHVRNCRFVGHCQLFELLQYDAVASSRTTFNWRVHRLLKARYISRLESVCWQGSPIYSVTQNGLLELESQGDFAIILNSRTRHMPHRSQVFHALELNAIRLALARNLLLVSWQSDVEIGSLNVVSTSPFQKDYDAIVKIWLGQEVREFALEYERSLKSSKQYAHIRAALEAEHRVPSILYVTVDPDLMLALLYQLLPASKPIGFLTARCFKQELLAAMVRTDACGSCVSLERFLEFSHPLYMAAQ